jgi:FtsH-binding integral membrane protein
MYTNTNTNSNPNSNYQPNYPSDFEIGLNSDSKQSSLTFNMRMGFIKKVYGIIAAQLAMTVLTCLISMSSVGFRKFQIEHSSLFIFSLVLSIILPCVIVCFQSTMRIIPYNYIILFSFTAAESYVVSFICSTYNPKLVFMAAFMTMSLVISLTIYAMTTKTDFTMQGGLLFVLGCGVFMFGFFLLFSQNKFLHIIFCIIGIVLFGLYLIYDTQLILGNKENALEVDDYILAAFILYTDIVYLFLKILELIQLLSGSNSE